jgi:oligopeptide/dipeptide ABC transporter ATP-binding protein
MTEQLLTVDGLVKHFPVSSSFFRYDNGPSLRAVDGISFFILPGETFGLVGESGSGKSTTARLITRLIDATGGRIYFRGREILGLSKGVFQKLRRHIQMVFQDPYSSLNPRMRVKDILSNPIRLHGVVPESNVEDRVVELLETVGLQAEHRSRYPHEFSGGQRQRISIARAMALEPDLIIADEPVSSLDVSVRAQILNLFRSLRETKKLAYLFIAHDLSVVEHFCERVAVMYGGKIVELALVDNLFGSPLHPYTEALISAIPQPDPRLPYKPRLLKGEVSNLLEPPRGCIFKHRCPLAQKLCFEVEPIMEQKKPQHWTACHLR